MNRHLNRRQMSHYQAPFLARCGQGVLVFYDGAPENGKTQLDEHEEICPKCKEHEKNGTFFDGAYERCTKNFFKRHECK